MSDSLLAGRRSISSKKKPNDIMNVNWLEFKPTKKLTKTNDIMNVKWLKFKPSKKLA